MKIMCMEKYFTVCGIGNGGGMGHITKRIERGGRKR